MKPRLTDHWLWTAFVLVAGLTLFGYALYIFVKGPGEPRRRGQSSMRSTTHTGYTP